jgi:hypothetical protein
VRYVGVELLFRDAGHRLGILEHFPEKWAPVFRKKMRQTKKLERFPIHLKRKAL